MVLGSVGLLCREDVRSLKAAQIARLNAGLQDIYGFSRRHVGHVDRITDKTRW